MKIFQISLLILVLFPLIGAHAQHIFSEQKMEYKKPFNEHDLHRCFDVGEEEFVMLMEGKKHIFTLGRYDKYLFSKWEKKLEFLDKESVPQIFLKGDSAIIINYTYSKKEKKASLRTQIFDTKNGEELFAQMFDPAIDLDPAFVPVLSLSEDKSMLLLYHYATSHEGEPRTTLTLFRIGNSTPLKDVYVNPDMFSSSVTTEVHINNQGDILLAVADPVSFKANVFFWGFENTHPIILESNYFFERPPDKIGKIEIQHTGSHEYFLAFSALIEKELIGFTAMLADLETNNISNSKTVNFHQQEISDLYSDYITTSDKQKKKQLKIPSNLEDFTLLTSYSISSGDVILIFEKLETPVLYQQSLSGINLEWYPEIKEDKYYLGEDIALICISPEGIIRWKKVIQKIQYSKENALSLSYLVQMKDNIMQMLIWDSVKNGKFFLLGINTLDGNEQEKIELIANKSYDYTKNYSCFIDENFILLCGISPGNSQNRKILLIEMDR